MGRREIWGCLLVRLLLNGYNRALEYYRIITISALPLYVSFLHSLLDQLNLDFLRIKAVPGI